MLTAGAGGTSYHGGSAMVADASDGPGAGGQPGVGGVPNSGGAPGSGVKGELQVRVASRWWVVASAPEDIPLLAQARAEPVAQDQILARTGAVASQTRALLARIIQEGAR